MALLHGSEFKDSSCHTVLYQMSGNEGDLNVLKECVS